MHQPNCSVGIKECRLDNIFFVTISAADVIRNSYEDNNDDTMFARVGLKRRLVIIQDETMPGEGGLG